VAGPVGQREDAHLARPPVSGPVKLQLALSLLALTCGQVLCWRRRDNVQGYLQGGLFFASVLVPLVGTSVVDSYPQELVNHYANVVTVGAACYLVGLAYGSPLGSRGRLPPVTFDRPLPRAMPRFLVGRARWAALAGVVALAASFKLLGYVPLLAADPKAAKYGVGAYRAGFARGSLAYHIALTLASTVLPIILAVAYRRRRRLDVALCCLLGLGLLATLNRGQAFTGPLVFLVAVAVQRGGRPWRILGGVCLAFVAGTLVNEIVYTSPPTASPSFASRVAATAPDISDQLSFLNGFELGGKEYVGTRTLQAAASLGREKGEYDPSAYAVRTITGLSDLNDLASGGARLPAPVWGFAAYGFVGAAAWSFVAGFFSGWGTSLVRRLVSPVQDSPSQSVNLILATVFYNGTFGVLATFYFPQRTALVAMALAIGLGVSLRRRRAEPEPAEAAAVAG
jgi:hypothetical protein